jgi:Phosphatidylglycerophosphate synthase
MLDTHARKYVQPMIDKTADELLMIRLSANQVTVLAFAVGLTPAVFIWLGHYVTAVILLWVSGFLDAVDGSMARKTRPTPWGTLMDITFDRLVECGIILALAFRFQGSMWALLLLTVAIIFSMTVFLTVGALSEKHGVKSFYYQAGLAERTEGFILFSLMILLYDYLTLLTLLFLAAETFTALQRMAQARRLLK